MSSIGETGDEVRAFGAGRGRICSRRYVSAITITVTVHCTRACTETWTLLSGSITHNVTDQDGTTTTVACNPTSFQAGQATTCTVTVTDLASGGNVPTGSVSFATSYGSTTGFSSSGVCALCGCSRR